MNEVPMSFDIPPNRTMDNVRAETIIIKTTGKKRTCFTLIVSSMSGNKRPPLVIFKRKTTHKKDFSRSYHVLCNEKRCVTEDVTQKWIDEVLRKRKGSFCNEECLLIMDSVRAHFLDTVKKAEYLQKQ